MGKVYANYVEFLILIEGQLPFTELGTSREKPKRVASKNTSNRSCDRVTFRHQNGPVFSRKRLQLQYIQKGQCPPAFKDFQVHKLLYSKGIGGIEKIEKVFKFPKPKTKSW